MDGVDALEKRKGYVNDDDRALLKVGYLSFLRMDLHHVLYFYCSHCGLKCNLAL